MGYSGLNDITKNVLINLTQKFESRFTLEYASGVYRHPIPYVLLKHIDKYFFILRECGSGETRLIGKIGLVGGHVGEEDKDNDALSTIINGMGRELLEEACVTKDKILSTELKGIIRSNEGVDQDHLGLIFLIDLNTDKIKSEEDGIISGIWVHKNHLSNHYDNFENWSKIVYDNILK